LKPQYGIITFRRGLFLEVNLGADASDQTEIMLPKDWLAWNKTPSWRRCDGQKTSVLDAATKQPN
jgi:hypothetical protein